MNHRKIMMPTARWSFIPAAVLLLVLTTTFIGAQPARGLDEAYKRGMELFNKGDLDGAIAEFDRAIDAYLNDKDSFSALPVRAEQNGVTAGYGDLAVQIPVAAALYQNRGLARFRRGDVEAAIADFTESIKIAP